jgi:hypothetical protein
MFMIDPCDGECYFVCFGVFWMESEEFFDWDEG